MLSPCIVWIMIYLIIGLSIVFMIDDINWKAFIFITIAWPILTTTYTVVVTGYVIIAGYKKIQSTINKSRRR